MFYLSSGYNNEKKMNYKCISVKLFLSLGKFVVRQVCTIAKFFLVNFRQFNQNLEFDILIFDRYCPKNDLNCQENLIEATLRF